MDTFSASVVASLLSFTVCWPFEVVKYKKQTDITRTYKSILRELYPNGFFRGYVPSAFGVVPKHSIPLFSKGYIDAYINQGVIVNNSVVTLLTTAITTPLTNVSLRRVHFPTDSATKYYWSNPGGLVSGFRIALLKDGIRIGLKFGIYDLLPTDTTGTTGTTVKKWQTAAMNGVIATVVTTVVSNPVDVILTKQQSDYTRQGVVGGVSVVATVRSMVDVTSVRNTLKVMYSGMVPRLARSIPGPWVMFGTYEYLRGFSNPLQL